jgi:hypothetical protein
LTAFSKPCYLESGARELIPFLGIGREFQLYQERFFIASPQRGNPAGQAAIAADNWLRQVLSGGIANPARLDQP